MNIAGWDTWPLTSLGGSVTQTTLRQTSQDSSCRLYPLLRWLLEIGKSSLYLHKVPKKREHQINGTSYSRITSWQSPSLGTNVDSILLLSLKLKQCVDQIKFNKIKFLLHQKCLSRGESVLVHCLAGAHRFYIKSSTSLFTLHQDYIREPVKNVLADFVY